jgi:hypothetical protein
MMTEGQSFESQVTKQEMSGVKKEGIEAKNFLPELKADRDRLMGRIVEFQKLGEEAARIEDLKKQMQEIFTTNEPESLKIIETLDNLILELRTTVEKDTPHFNRLEELMGQLNTQIRNIEGGEMN